MTNGAATAMTLATTKLKLRSAISAIDFNISYPAMLLSVPQTVAAQWNNANPTPTQKSLVQIAVALGLFGHDPKVLRVHLDYVSQLQTEAAHSGNSSNNNNS